MLTLHPTAKKTAQGYLPMITMRGAKGRMLGSRVPQGDCRDWQMHETAIAAEIDARLIALRVASRNADIIRVADDR